MQANAFCYSWKIPAQNFSYLLGSIFYSLITSPDPNCSVGERDGLKCVETLKNVSHEDALQRCSDNNMELWSGQSDQVKYCHNPSPSQSQKSKVTRTWSDSILLTNTFNLKADTLIQIKN